MLCQAISNSPKLGAGLRVLGQSKFFFVKSYTQTLQSPVCCVLYSGMMAIPRAYYMMGSLLGTASLVVVGLLTYWTLVVMIKVKGGGGKERWEGGWCGS